MDGEVASSALLARAAEVSQAALACGALQPAQVRKERIEEAGIRFLVHVLVKDWSKSSVFTSPAQTPPVNPFLPYNRDLFVQEFPTGHVCVLNKYNVLPNHLLLVTPEFVEQETCLELADFAAYWRCLAEFDGFAFYNSGPQAGASQRHKHLQVAPLPFDEDEPSPPIEGVLASAPIERGFGCAPALPFVHRFAPLALSWSAASEDEAASLLHTYHVLLSAVGIDRANPRPAPYNLLLTRRWMMIVSRTRHAYAGIPVNALGYAGSLLAKNEEQLQFLRTAGPLTVLRHTGVEAGAP